MRILSIESSADETSISLVEATGDFPKAKYEILGDALHSQVKLHEQYGGIFPMMAKREHAKAIVPLLKLACTEAELLESIPTKLNDTQIESITTILAREEELAETFLAFLHSYELPDIDVVAVTSGPGLEPALWVGISFAKALAVILECPVVPVNHLEGHILAAIYNVVDDDALAPIAFPAVALLISGGHTELIVMKDWVQYEKIGQTRDDAVGEAFDKVARLMGFPYPGGPEIGRRAARARIANLPPYKGKLPRPMIGTDDCDFSFSGLKTAVRYAIDSKAMTESEKNALSRDFEDAVTEVLLKKTIRAINISGAQSLIIGGGVSASEFIRRTFQTELLASHPKLEIYFPQRTLSTDNSIMIALAGHAQVASGRTGGALTLLKADGNRSL